MAEYLLNELSLKRCNKNNLVHQWVQHAHHLARRRSRY